MWPFSTVKYEQIKTEIDLDEDLAGDVGHEK